MSLLPRYSEIAPPDARDDGDGGRGATPSDFDMDDALLPRRGWPSAPFADATDRDLAEREALGLNRSPSGSVPDAADDGEDGNGRSSRGGLPDLRRLVAERGAEELALELELRCKEEDPEAFERDPERVEQEPPDEDAVLAQVVAAHEADLLEGRRRTSQIHEFRLTVEASFPGWWERHTECVPFLWALCQCDLGDEASVRDLLRLVAVSYECEGRARAATPR